MFNKQAILLSPPTTQCPPSTQITAIPKIIKDPLKFLLDARTQYGDIYTMNLGVSKLIILNHPQHAQYVLRDNARNFSKGGPLWESIGTILGNGLPVSEGDFWLRQRRMMQPHFHRKRLVALTDLMVEAIDEAMVDWQTAATTSLPFEVEAAFPHITMKVIVKTLFGTGLSAQKMEEVSHALTYALDYMLRGMITNQFPAWMPVPGRNRYQRAIDTIDAIVSGIIEQRRRANEEGNDLLTMLLHMVDDETGEQMTDKQLRDEAVTMFLAGYETTAVALTWATHFLVTHPESMAKLSTEVDSVLGDRSPTFADLRQLPYARMIIQEALRLYPPAWWMSRTAREDDEIDGYHIPAGSIVAPTPYTIHRHPEFWSNPDKFDPERFAPEKAADRHQLAWMPFGAGQRICIGKEFALMEGQLILARMVQQFRLTAVPDYEVRPRASTTLRTKDGVFVHLEKRSK